MRLHHYRSTTRANRRIPDSRRRQPKGESAQVPGIAGRSARINRRRAHLRSARRYLPQSPRFLLVVRRKAHALAWRHYSGRGGGSLILQRQREDCSNRWLGRRPVAVVERYDLFEFRETAGRNFARKEYVGDEIRCAA